MSKKDHPVFGNQTDYLVVDLVNFSNFIKNNDHNDINYCYTHPLFLHLAFNLNQEYIPIQIEKVNRFNLSKSSPLNHKIFMVDKKCLGENFFHLVKLVVIDIVPFVKLIIELEDNFPQFRTDKPRKEAGPDIKAFRKAVKKWENKYKKTVLKQIEKHDILQSKEFLFAKGFVSFGRGNRWNKPYIRKLVKKLEKRYQIPNHADHTKNITDRDIGNTNIELTKYPDYCEIGFLLVVKKDIWKEEFDFFYKDRKFKSAKEIESYLLDKKIVKARSIRQYVGDSFNDGQKSLYKPHRLKKIGQYCKSINYSIPEDLIDNYPELNNLH